MTVVLPDNRPPRGDTGVQQAGGRGAEPGGSRVLAPAAWLLDATAFRAEFSTLWNQLGDPAAGRRAAAVSGDTAHPGMALVRSGDTTALREVAARRWSSDDPVVAGHVARMAVSSPDEWSAGFDDGHLGAWFRLCLAGHLTPVASPSNAEILRTGLPQLGWSPLDTRRLLRGRELGELATAMDPDGFGPAVALALGHGHKGWLDADDAAAARTRLVDTDRSRFRTAQHLVGPCEQLWDLLVSLADDDDRVLVLALLR